jgi:hypothetical protein
MAELSEEEKAELGTMREATARALYWTQQLINAPNSGGFLGMRDHAFPVPPSVLNLLFATGCLLGVEPKAMKDACGDLSWDALKQVYLSRLTPHSSLSV